MNKRIEEFQKEPLVKKYLNSPREFVGLVKRNYHSNDPIATFKRLISPVIMPVEFEANFLDLWRTIKRCLPKPE